MTPASRVRGVAVLVAGAVLLAACTGGGNAGSSSAAPAPTLTSASASPAPSPTSAPTPSPSPPPLVPGTSRGRLLVVQQAEDAALVSGGQPILLTRVRTGNVASWLTSPPQKLAVTM